MTETSIKDVRVELDSSQVAGTIAAANHINSLPLERRGDEDVMKEAIKIAKEVRDEVRARRLALGMPARDAGRSWDAQQSGGKQAGGLGVDAAALIPPTLTELAQRRYLVAVNRVMSGKIDDPRYSMLDLADIADVLGAGSQQFATMDDFVKQRTP